MACHKLLRAKAASLSLTAISYHIRTQHSITQTQNHSKEMPQAQEYWGVATNGQSVGDRPPPEMMEMFYIWIQVTVRKLGIY